MNTPDNAAQELPKHTFAEAVTVNGQTYHILKWEHRGYEVDVLFIGVRLPDGRKIELQEVATYEGQPTLAFVRKAVIKHIKSLPDNTRTTPAAPVMVDGLSLDKIRIAVAKLNNVRHSDNASHRFVPDATNAAIDAALKAVGMPDAYFFDSEFAAPNHEASEQGDRYSTGIKQVSAIPDVREREENAKKLQNTAKSSRTVTSVECAICLGRGRNMVETGYEQCWKCRGTGRLALPLAKPTPDLAAMREEIEGLKRVKFVCTPQSMDVTDYVSLSDVLAIICKHGANNG